MSVRPQKVVGSRLASILSGFRKDPARASRVVIFLPYLIYEHVRLQGDIEAHRWQSVIRRAHRLRARSFGSDYVWYSAGVAHTALEDWSGAIAHFDSVQAPLDEIDDEALRYNCHAWALHHLGCTAEAQALLRHAMCPNWPPRRLQWAESFAQAAEPGSAPVH